MTTLIGNQRLAAKMDNILRMGGIVAREIMLTGLTCFVAVSCREEAEQVVALATKSSAKSARVMQDDPEDGGGFYAEIGF